MRSACRIGVVAVAILLVGASTVNAREINAPSLTPRPCAPDAPPAIFVYSGSYDPATQAVGDGTTSIGGRQYWYWNGGTTSPVTASVTYNGKLALFDSGVLTSTGGNVDFSYNFTAAGTYPYYSTVDTAQTGQIQVKLCIKTTATVNTKAYIQPGAPATGFLEDVEVKKPHATTWGWLKYGVAGTFSWTPTLKGTYQLRARLRRVSNTTVSEFSPPSNVSVN